MKDENWQQTKQILAQALEKTSTSREEFLIEVCKTNTTLKKEVMALLAYDEKVEGFLSAPIVDVPLAANPIQSQANQQNANQEKPRSLQEMLISLIGETLDGKYLIEEQLGQGGMGAVFKATHLGTDRPVALKIINPQFMTNDEFIERFKREAKAAGRLSHPNVVNVTDFGFTKIGIDNIAYLVMEYLNGCTLARLLAKKKTFPLEFVVDIIEQTCLAIELAHKRGIIHRDLKPDNIWLEPNERGGYNVKVLDFGIAKLRNTINNSNLDRALPKSINNIKENFNQTENDSLASTLIKDQINNLSQKSLTLTYGEELKPNIINTVDTVFIDKRSTLENLDPQTENSWFTEVGAIVGTPTYMSPEQCQSKQLDARSDIYSLGIIVYKMLSGEAPFKGDFLQVMFHHSNIAAPQLKEKCPKLPTRVTDVVMSALAKDPENRPVSAIAFSIALKTAMEGEAPIISQAVELFRNNFVKFFRISVLINLPIVLFSAVLICFLQQNTTVYPGFRYIAFLWWLLPLLIIMLAGRLNILAFAPIIKQFNTDKTIDIPIKQIFLNVRKNLPKMLITTAYESLATLTNLVKFIIPGFRKHIELLMSPCVVAMEELEGKVALERSNKLIKPIETLATNIQIRYLMTSFTIFFLSFLPFCLDELIDFSDKLVFFIETEQTGFYILAFIAIVLIPGLIAIFLQPVIAIVFLQLYLKSRRVLGESINGTSEQIKINNFIPTYSLRKNRNKLVLASLMIVTLLLSSISYTLFVPPAEIIKLDLPKIEKIPDSENAWVEYKLALGELVKLNMMSTLNPSEFSSGSIDLKTSIYSNQYTALLKPYQDFYEEVIISPKLTEQQKSFLDTYKPAINYLTSANKKTKAQYYTNQSADTKTLRINPALSLTSITLAQAHRLMLEGREQEAIDIVLVIHKMSVDLMSEPFSPIGHYVIGTMVRNKTIRTLFIWMNSNSINPINYQRLVEKMESLESSIILPTQAIFNSYIEFEHDIREVLINSNINDISSYPLSKLNDIKPFYGLRLRTYNSLIQNYTNSMDKLRPYIKNYDFISINNYIESLDKPIYYWTPTLEKFIGKDSLKYALFGQYASLKTFYGFHSSALAWKAFAMCLAYKNTYGYFPSTLEDAFANSGVKIPYDSVTAKPIGYRLENGIPVVWLAGFDGLDDGGKIGCTYENYGKTLPGQDWVFRFGELPFWYGSNTNQKSN